MVARTDALITASLLEMRFVILFTGTGPDWRADDGCKSRRMSHAQAKSCCISEFQWHLVDDGLQATGVQRCAELLHKSLHELRLERIVARSQRRPCRSSGRRHGLRDDPTGPFGWGL